MSEIPSNSYISGTTAAKIDKELMSDTFGYSIDQLMELAGLSVAQAVTQCYHPNSNMSRVLVVCGPGNNGGDGLVAARHLKQFGYSNVSVLYPKRHPENLLYMRLLKQLDSEEIPVVECLEELNLVKDNSLNNSFNLTFDLIIDALFGFSFTGSVREPFSKLIQLINSCHLPIVSIDIPSGWDVSLGPIKDEIYIQTPSVIVSLMAPKECILQQNALNIQLKQSFNTKDHRPQCLHFIGRPYIPKVIAQKYNLILPYWNSNACHSCGTDERIVSKNDSK